MKQLLSLFLFLLPCLAWAQYPTNGNQKITLGEQTTADGLVYRGVLGDTFLITPSSDTSAYIILDTVNHRFYNYNRATNVWSMAGVGSISSGLTGVLPVANGGTGNSTTYISGAIPYSNGTSLVSDTSKIFFNSTNKRIGIGTSNPTNPVTVLTNVSEGIQLNAYDDARPFIILNSFVGTDAFNQSPAQIQFARWNTSSFNTADTNRLEDGTILGRINFFGNAGLTRGNRAGAQIAAFATQSGSTSQLPSNMRIVTSSTTNDRLTGTDPQIFISYLGRVGLHTDSPSEALHVVGNARISGLAGTGSRAVIADLNGVLSAPVSTINSKENVNAISYGLNDVLKLKPVSFNFIDKYKWGERLELGFIVEDMFSVIPEVTGIVDGQLLYLDMVKLIPVLTKAIQEQNNLIKFLEQRIINLENK